MSAQFTYEITRWTMLRVWPRAWREALRSVAVNGRELTPWHPFTWALFVVGAWTLLFTRRIP